MNPDITYEAVPPAIKVFLKTRNKPKRVGTIKQVTDGWAYFPKGHGPGDTYPSITAVKRSIEDE